MLTLEQLEAEIKRVGELLAWSEIRYLKYGCIATKSQIGNYELQMRRLVDAREAKAATQ